MGEKTFGNTLRLTTARRKALRRLAETETTYRGRVVPVHTLIIEAIDAMLRRYGAE